MSEAPSFPLGESAKLAAVEKRWPTVLVDNTVVWTNPRFSSFPIDLKEGRPCKLALFVKSDRDYQTATGPSLTLFPEHRRTGILPRFLFADDEGSVFRETDIKGCGFVFLSAGIPILNSPYETGRYLTAPAGLADLPYLNNEASMSERLYKLGIRVTPTVAIVRLNEIYCFTRRSLWERVSITEAKKRGTIGPKRIPAIAVRAFVTKYRIKDMVDDESWDKSTRELVLNDAIKIVSQELKTSPENLTNEKYLEWFAAELGKQVGILHRAGYLHGYLTGHNITLDCRITDTDSVKRLPRFYKRKEKILNDFDRARRALETLSLAVHNLALELCTAEKIFPLLDIFDRNYCLSTGNKITPRQKTPFDT